MTLGKIAGRALFCLIAFQWSGGAAMAQEDAPAQETPAQEVPAQDAVPQVGEEVKLPLYVRHPHREQRDKYIFGTFGPPGLMAAAISAGLEQWRNSPKEWGQGDNAYFKRFASEYAGSAISDTTKYWIARLRDEDPSFRPCECSGIHRRFAHAVISPFIARKPDGRTVFSYARISAMSASSVITSTWNPVPQGPRAQLKHVGVNLAGTIGVDLLREFFLHHRKKPAPVAVTPD